MLGWNLKSVPKWALVWFYVSFLIQIWDALFILARPHSLAGGALEYVWSPYQLYITVDRRYGDLGDGFGIAQSWLNLLEVVVGFWGLNMYMGGQAKAHLYLFSASLMSFAKTCIYFLTEFCSGLEYTGGADWYQWTTIFFIPSLFWVVFPLLCTLGAGSVISQQLSATRKARVE
mmetsp:Transcript_27393/g.68769  ORF Transcript_27393/g.68769 Transcript_27393/m.68769 type:complete len:174 (-) Transcript_27393:49-570(-)|eukprot:CAMPEP_0177637016 /NCGR_PEP_ID=MMETSP0447-20121125/4750_1 /TAXON_ID=0 /ORGANISM="Stygamoeba regulata, Strain BSH-02190019" /LENGTH=173 /DNA_ID=CAMNT_0019138923 /DNA_START=118 /DNA_END=639 /DNA_ORIENTATION=+